MKGICMAWFQWCELLCWQNEGVDDDDDVGDIDDNSGEFNFTAGSQPPTDDTLINDATLLAGSKLVAEPRKVSTLLSSRYMKV